MLWDIFRCYTKLNPTKVKQDTPGGKILAVEPELQANFSFNKSILSESMEQGVPKFLPNPEANWGPGSRAKIKQQEEPSSFGGQKRTMHEAMAVKARENQGKRQKKAAESTPASSTPALAIMAPEAGKY